MESYVSIPRGHGEALAIDARPKVHLACCNLGWVIDDAGLELDGVVGSCCQADVRLLPLIVGQHPLVHIQGFGTVAG
jgi:hypothetical protein